MKTLTKILAAVLVVTMLFTLCACGNDGDANSGTAIYQVKVLDVQGNPCSSVIVKFLQGDKEAGMQPINDDGIASKELNKGDYTVQLMYTDGSTGYYDTASAVLSANNTSLDLTLFNSQTLYASGAECIAHEVYVGDNYVPAKADIRNYFLFVPTKAGTYVFGVDNADIKIGYYGAPHFVQEYSAIDVVDNKITVSVSASALGGSYVIGLDGANADTDAVLSIIRTGDPTVTLSDLPWTEYKTTHKPTPYTLDLGGKSLKYIDIKGKTEDNQVFYNDADGYYHFGTADGPIVLMHLGKKVNDTPAVSLQTVIEGDGLGGGAPIRKYFFDGKGTAPENFIKKEDYTDILRTYFANMDQNAGVYPLTKDLEYIVKNGCDGWWDKNDPDYIFTDCNPEIGWMFALCYVG